MRTREKNFVERLRCPVSRKKQIEIGMENGVIWAAAYLVQGHGQDTLAEYMLQESGIDPNTCGDEYDREILKGVIDVLNSKHKPKG